MVVNELTVLNLSKSLPFELHSESIISNEDIRLKYRYLELREKNLKNNIILRHKVKNSARNFLNKEQFLEIETPLLAKSTPEGARDYLIPSRVHKNKFFALPQSPQLFKELLMIAGFDKYYQFAKCLRDEDLRADRQPEFTQLDLEMSFVNEEDIMDLCERLIFHIFKEVLNLELEIPFEKITYEEAIKKYGSDKPDLRKKDERFKFVWITNFPMFEKNEKGDIQAMHHPFTMPKNFSENKDLLKLKARSYDLVLNGWEIRGGSIRIHKKELQKRIFNIIGLSEKEVLEQFGFLLEALELGAPPLGGIALGLSRLICLMAGEDYIRKVIAFPKNKSCKDLMLGCPSKVSEEQLKEIGWGRFYEENVPD